MDLVINGHPLTVAAGDYDWFWERVASGAWEPETFRVYDRYVDARTTVLDVGAWIGPTALYAAHLARKVYAFEPDPRAFAELQANAACNPALAVEPVNAAVGLAEGTARLKVRGAPGDSMSSLIYARAGEGYDVRALRLDAFVEARGVEGPLFVKVDVEGFEYALVPALRPLLTGRPAVLYLSTHPWLVAEQFEKRIHLVGIERRLGFRADVLRRLVVLAASVRLVRALRGFRLFDVEGAPLTPRAVVRRALRQTDPTPDTTLVAVSPALPA